MESIGAPTRIPSYRPARLGAWLQTFAALLWLVQAGCIAWAAQGLLEGRGLAVALPAAIAVGVVGVLRALAGSMGSRCLYRRARHYVSSLRAFVIRALAARSPLDVHRAPSGLAASVLAEQAETLLPYLARYAAVRQRVVLVPCTIAAVVAWHSWVAALVLVLSAPLIPIFMALVGWRAKAASEAQLVQLGDMNAFLLDRLRGLTTLRALGAVGLTARRLEASAQSLRSRTMRVLRIAFLSSAVLEFFSALGVALVAVYVGFQMLGHLSFGAWGQTLSLGQGLFILMLAPAFFEPLRELAAVWHDRAAGTAAMTALQTLADRGTVMPAAQDPACNCPPVDEGDDRKALAGQLPGRHSSPGDTPVRLPAIRLQRVTLHAPNDTRPIVRNLSLEVAEGEHVALMGASGSGKSMLLAAVAGLLPVAQGHIEVCGLSPAQGVAQRRIGWIGQKPHVFAGTVYRNVTLQRPDVGRQDVERALALAKLVQVAQAHAAQTLGEGGQGLSGGEAARLALARVAADPSIRIILADEPTAHLDRQTAHEIIQSLLLLARGRTLLVATHDPVLAAAVDRRVSIDARASLLTPVRDAVSPARILPPGEQLGEVA